MNLLRNREGSMFQFAMILFFVLLVILALVLLTFEAKRLQTTRPELAADLRDQRANTFLISLLRSQATAPPQELQGASMADLLIINSNGRYDAALNASLAGALSPQNYFQLTILYPDGRQLEISNIALTGFGSFVVERYGGNGAAILPAGGKNIRITILYFDKDVLENAANVGFTPGDNKQLSWKVTTGATAPEAGTPSQQHDSKPLTQENYRAMDDYAKRMWGSKE